MKSLRFKILLFSLLLTGVAFGQNADSVLLKELDAQIWRPFIQHYNAFDSENFNKLHTQDVLRGGPWGLRVGETYFKDNIKWDKKSKEEGEKRQIAFRFEYRVTTDSIAYEVGYYRVKAERSGKEIIFYGRFDVVSKKVKGVWKIAQDWDVDDLNGKPFSEVDFLGEKPNPIIYE